MQISENIEPISIGRLPDVYRMNVHGGPGLVTRDGASMRMVAAMADPFRAAARSLFDDEDLEIPLTPFAGSGRESDARYYRRRSKEELRAAGEAEATEARRAHEELADRYDRLSQSAIRRGDSGLESRSVARARVADMLRQRFGRSMGGPGRLAAGHANRQIEAKGREPDPR